jgi:DNA-binding response OmpR family regulator
LPEKRVLLLEDDEIVATMLEGALSTVGYAVDVARA